MVQGKATAKTKVKAKGKKEELTPEKRLEQALVLEEEQPYVVPENWVWVNLNAVCDFERGITFPASAKNDETSRNLIACLRTANVQENLDISDLLFVDKSYMKNNLNKFVRVNDIIMSSANSRELVGKVSFVDFLRTEMTFGGFILAIRATKVESKFLFYFLRLQFLAGKFMGKSTQTTNIANINTTKLGKYTFPLPPLTEQHRIVERIESLFEKLDRAKELVQTALDSFETRKAAILHKAFTGELTVKWREENGVGMDSWEEKKLGECLSDIKAGKCFRCIERPPQGDEIGVVKVSSVTWGTFDTRESKTCTDIDKINPTILIKKGDFLFSRANTLELVGACVIVEETSDNLMLSDKILRFTFLNNYIPKYILLFLRSKNGRKEIENLSSGNQLSMRNITQNNIRRINIHLPSFAEQKEIVRILDSLFEKEQCARELCDVIEKIELMKKTILARAFRGELGTNDPREESAVELLKEVLMKP